MIYHTVESLKGTDRDVQANGYTSMRFLLKEDNMGFTVTEAFGEAGFSEEVEYVDNLEAVYVIEGTGTIELLDTGEIFKIAPGVFYAFDKHERHRYHLETEVRAIAIMNPPLVGGEILDETGKYPDS